MISTAVAIAAAFVFAGTSFFGKARGLDTTIVPGAIRAILGLRIHWDRIRDLA